jgi:16S rRNA processing protein RimM
MEVETEDGGKLGRVVRIFTAGENDVYEVLPDGAKKGDEILIPAIGDVIISVDVEAKRMVIRPLEGMLDEE